MRSALHRTTLAVAAVVVFVTQSPRPASAQRDRRAVDAFADMEREQGAARRDEQRDRLERIELEAERARQRESFRATADDDDDDLHLDALDLDD